MIGHWEWVIAKGVLLGQLMLIGLGVIVLVVGPWVHGLVRTWRRRR